MEISKPSLSVFYLSRLLGLAPYLIKESKQHFEFRQSVIISVYSIALVTSLVFLTYSGLLYDANSKIPIRMKSTTSKVVTALDVSVVVFACLAGVISGLRGLKPTQEINRRLKEADDLLVKYTNEVKDRKRGYFMVCAVLLSITIMLVCLVLDIWSWYRMARKLGDGFENTEINVRWYIPFYSLYYILMGLHIHLAQSALGLGKRYRRLNLALKNILRNCAEGKIFAGRTGSIEEVNHTVDQLRPNLLKVLSTIATNPLLPERQCLLIDRLAHVHASLGKAMGYISETYGLAALLILGSCLLHLVATSYFLFLQLFGEKDTMFSWLQLLWVLFHFLRLLLIVEPCHITSQEARRTVLILCDFERNCYNNSMGFSTKKFWRQLMSDQPHFSSCGLCNIDRQILTSFGGAIATYLVILIQFQKTDG